MFAIKITFFARLKLSSFSFLCNYICNYIMQTKLIQIGNSYGVRLPINYIKQLGLDKGTIEISIKKDGILISPVIDIPPLDEWDRLFVAAKKAGFDPKSDAESFKDWDSTLADGIN